MFKSGRGGQYTYHGPGQRIAYVMLDLDRPAPGRGRDVRCHVWRLEEWMIRVLRRFGLAGERRDGRIGVWIDGPDGRENKIAAIGVRVRRNCAGCRGGVSSACSVRRGCRSYLSRT